MLAVHANQDLMPSVFLCSRNASAASEIEQSDLFASKQLLSQVRVEQCYFTNLRVVLGQYSWSIPASPALSIDQLKLNRPAKT